MKLTNTYEKILRNGESQTIIITSTNVYSRSEAAELGYDDFTADLYFNNKYIGDISPVLAKSPAWFEMVDSTDWEELYCDIESDKQLDESENFYHD
jgi:hypothetical protein